MTHSDSKWKVSRHDLILYASCLAFAADSVANYFFPIPALVLSIPALILIAMLAIHSQRLLLATMIPIGLITFSLLVNLARFGYSQEDVSDALFLILTVAYLGASLTGAPSRRALSSMTLLFALLFLPAFFGVNNSFGNEDALASGSTDLEFLRSYKQGLYRIPHLAAYMLAFGAMWWFALWEREHKLRYVAASLIFMACCLYTGSRTPVFIFLIGFMASFLDVSFKRISLFIIALIAAALAVINIDELLKLTEGTFLYQYPSAVKTAITDFDRLSRAIIWSSWLSAMKELGPLDYIVGHSFANSMKYNEIHLGTAIWFHNDFLSIIYSYGAPSLLAYIGITLLTTSRLKTSEKSRARAIIVTFVLASGFVNGFYKYLPVVFLFILSFLHFNSSTAASKNDTRQH